MPRRRLYTTIVVSFALAAAALLSGCGGKEQPEADPAGVFSGRVSAADSVAFEDISVDSTTVFELLSEHHEVDYKFYGRNIFVVAVDSIYQGNNHMWLYSVNSAMSRNACNLYRIGAGDTVRWFFRDITK